MHPGAHGAVVCARVSTFDIGATAASYSTVAGVMAGFAFASLLYLITTDGLSGHAESKRDVAAQALGAAFIVLLLSSVTDAVLAGEATPGGRAATVELLAGASLSIAGIHLIYALVPLIRLHPGRAESVTVFFRAVGGRFLCPVAYLLVLLSADDYQHTAAHPTLLTIATGWVLLMLVVGCAIAMRNERMFEFLARAKLNSSHIAIVACCLIIATVAIVEAHVPQCGTATPLMAIVILTSAAVVLVNQMLAFEAPHESIELREAQSVREPVRAAGG